MERLAETTPTPPQHILTDFTKRFKEYTDVSKPAETNGLAKIKVFREEVRIPSPLGLTGIVIRTPPEDTVSTKE
jgi:hypothetical protein